MTKKTEEREGRTGAEFSMKKGNVAPDVGRGMHDQGYKFFGGGPRGNKLCGWVRSTKEDHALVSGKRQPKWDRAIWLVEGPSGAAGKGLSVNLAWRKKVLSRRRVCPVTGGEKVYTGGRGGGEKKQEQGKTGGNVPGDKTSTAWKNDRRRPRGGGN